MFLLAVLACAEEAAIGGDIPVPSAEERTAAETSGLESFSFDDANALFYVQLTAPADSKSHDHVVRAGGIEGGVSYDSSDPSSLSVEVSLPVGELLVDEPDMRAHLGLSDDLSEGNRASIQKHMRAEDQLDYPTFDSIHFVSTGYDGSTLSGDMTLHGVTVPIEVALTVESAEEGLYLEGSGTLVTPDFGIEPYSLGSYTNAEEIALVIDARGDR